MGTRRPLVSRESQNPALERQTASAYWKNRAFKKHFSDASIEYIDEFIMETCRGEWVHLNDCLCAVVLLLINPLLVGLVLSFFVLLGNLPCAIVQRYNRFRLQALRKKMLRDLSSAKIGQKTVTA
jgi:glycosyl-4,4'-diaponeurosporenoate acyltransferase